MIDTSIFQMIRKIGSEVIGQVEPWRVKFALDYLDHNEPVLAFDTLCSYIVECDARIGKNTFEKIADVEKSLGNVLGEGLFNEIKKLSFKD